MNLACQKWLGNCTKVLGIGVTPPPFWEKFLKNTVFFGSPPLITLTRICSMTLFVVLCPNCCFKLKQIFLGQKELTLPCHTFTVYYWAIESIKCPEIWTTTIWVSFWRAGILAISGHNLSKSGQTKKGRLDCSIGLGQLCPEHTKSTSTMPLNFF